MNVATLKIGIDNIITNNSSKEEKLQAICIFLEQQIPYYDWVGFYFKNGNKNELKLAKFTGEPTEHTIIPFGKGICGQVAVSNKNFVVQDEIVIPIFVNGENIGQIDIDSHTANTFTDNDVVLLEYVCKEVAKIL